MPKENLLKQIDNNFTYHPPKEGQAELYTSLREDAKKLAIRFVEECPESRELSLAITNLEQAMFWANAAIARNS